MKTLNIPERISKIAELQKLIKTPWHITRFGIELSIHGDQISLSNDSSADYETLQEIRTVVEYLSKELGGEVK